MDDVRNWLVTTVNDCLWWLMVDVGGWLQHMVGLDVLRWRTVGDDRNRLVTTTTMIAYVG